MRSGSGRVVSNATMTLLRLSFFALAMAPAALSQQAGDVIDVGSRRELFVDRSLIDDLVGARLELARPRDEGVALRFDRSWEGPFCGYSTVIADGERYLLYYRGLPKAGGDGTNLERTCVAVSSDGRRFERPELSRFEVAGAATNNVVLADAAPVSHNFSPFLDARVRGESPHRFKALGGNERSGLIAYSSADGISWTLFHAEPVLRGAEFDSQNVAFWSGLEQCYVCYMRSWTGDGYAGIRTVSRATSKDFVTWTEPQEMGFRDGLGALEHLYTNQTHPYMRAPHIYVGIAARFLPGRQVLSASDAKQLGVNPKYFRDCSDAVLLTSRGGLSYDRTFREAFLRPGVGLQNWVSRSNYPARNVVQTGPAEMSFYVNQNYAQPTAELRRYSLRLDGFASLRAGFEGGQARTRPLRFTGAQLELNFATSAAGSVRVALCAQDGSALAGYGLEDCLPLIGNDISRRVTWRRKGAATSDVSEHEGRVVRLRFELVDADLYAMQFAGER